jgi:tetratricopeptide (TPR) repeat protein
VMASFGIFICVILAAITISGVGGYFAGERDRALTATASRVADVGTQYAISLSDLQSGNYSMAAQRLQWVMTAQPDYPGGADALAQAHAGLNQTEAPVSTIAPSAGQGAESLFNEAQGFYNAQKWANAITRLQDVQSTDATYRPDEVKAMLYTSLVTLGLQYLRDVSSDHLEEGVGLLGQAEKIKPLDDQAGGERNLARLYQTGRTYDGINWQIAINNYEAIYAIAPNYRDVKKRLLNSYTKFADQLVLLGGHCDAAALYEHALALKHTDEVKTKFDTATTACANPTPTPFGGVTITPGGPTLTPFPTPSGAPEATTAAP